MPAKRAHKKSRNGCGICRARRVKCDEVHPECGPCRKHEVRCNYDRATFTPRRAASVARSESSISTKSKIQKPSQKWNRNMQFEINTRSPPAFGMPTPRMADLQLMNHYTYLHMLGTCSLDPKVRRLWVHDVPQRAASCNFLMQAILSFAALHLHIHMPEDSRMRLLSHHYFGTSLRMLMLQLSRIGPQNADMAFAASVMIQFQVFISWKDPCSHGNECYKPPVAWLEMCQGVGSILKSALSNVQNSFMKPLLDSKPNTIVSIMGALQPRGVGEDEYDPPFRHFGQFLQNDTSPAQIPVKKAYDLVHHLYNAKLRGDAMSIMRRRLLTFPNTLDPEFIELLRDSDPRAMITLCYYFGVMKMSQDIWWFHGRPEFEINGVWGCLGEEWRIYLQWPKEQIAGKLDLELGRELFEKMGMMQVELQDEHKGNWKPSPV